MAFGAFFVNQLFIQELSLLDIFDSLDFVYIKPTTTVARFIKHCFFGLFSSDLWVNNLDFKQSSWCPEEMALFFWYMT